jgi:hypothetical protein
MLQPQQQRRIVETSRQFVHRSVVSSHLTCIGAAIAQPVSNDEQPNLHAALQLCFTASVVHSLALEQRSDAATTGYVGPTTVPFRRVLD